MKRYLPLLFIFFSLTASAQFQFKGAVQDAHTHLGVEQIQILLTAAGSSSSMIEYTNAEGQFTFVLFEEGEYVLELSHIGYVKQTMRLKLTAKNTKDHVELIAMEPATQTIEEAMVSGLRATEKTPSSFTTLKHKEIQRLNTGQDMPFVLGQTTNAVTFSDAGAGVGYTGIRIRGVDQSRINVTMNGVPLNDAESHGVWWVNMPDLASSVNSIQIQRGVGTSTNGAAAFGASINVKTDHVQEKAYLQYQGGYGSFNTLRNSILFGTGKMDNGWGVQGRISKINSDGFIDRANSDLSSLFLTTARYGKKSLLKFNMMLGKERTYQAWNGVPQVKFEQDDAGVEVLISELFMSEEDAKLLRESNPNTFNPYTYVNEVDNYQQEHYQLFYNYRMTNGKKLQTGVYYTRGKGYYEGLNDDLNDSASSLFQYVALRQWLDNHFYGALFSIDGHNGKVNWVLGGDVNQYRGDHFDQGVATANTDLDPYKKANINDAIKSTANAYLKTNYDVSNKLGLFTDLQIRGIQYEFDGISDQGSPLPQTVDYFFFNPKLGVNYKGKSGLAYLTYGRSNREPVRKDFVEANPSNQPKNETLNNIELGYKGSWKKILFNLNVYGMYYDNQLVLTGQINDVGGNTRVNVGSSSREGVELDAQYVLNNFKFGGNVALGRTNIKEWTEHVGVDWGFSGYQETVYKDAPISFSPNTVGNVNLTYKLLPELELMLQSKYVGEQHLDNTGSDARKLSAYNTLDAVLFWNIKVAGIKNVSVQVSAFNLLNVNYAPNGYTFSNITGSQRSDYNYVFPMAGTYFLSKLVVDF